MGHAARLFNGAAEQTLYGRVTPTEEQREFLQEQWNALAAYLKESLQFKGYPLSTWLQGSYKFGTLIKPVHAGEEYDVDVGFYFSWDPATTNVSPSAVQLRNWIQEEIINFSDQTPAVRDVSIPPKERCSRATYQQHFHIDIPVYHLDPATDTRRLACLSGAWEMSDPKALYKWFKSVVIPDNRDQLRRLVRYMKGWAAVAFENTPTSRPSSILLTVVIAETYVELGANRKKIDLADDDALIAIISSTYLRLAADPCVVNPVDNTEDLNRIPEDQWETFIHHFSHLYDASQAANDADDEPSAALAWELAFSFLMPLPDNIDEVEVESDAGKSLMQIPDIHISVYDKPGGTLLAEYLNEVPSVPKNRWLVFKISNPAVVPDFEEVAWTVRNDGNEASTIGDLGHYNRGMKKIQQEESTAYLGRHFMDCVVRHNGMVYAARRVAVNVKPDQRLLAQQARKWLRSITRRRRRR